jgi:hypothetical protein
MITNFHSLLVSAALGLSLAGCSDHREASSPSPAPQAATAAPPPAASPDTAGGGTLSRENSGSQIEGLNGQKTTDEDASKNSAPGNRKVNGLDGLKVN